MHAHLKAGWVYSEYTGAVGGWEHRDDSNLIAIACKDCKRSRTWQSFVIRYDDGATLFHDECRTRDEAMAAAIGARGSDIVRHAAATTPLPTVLAIVEG